MINFAKEVHDLNISKQGDANTKYSINTPCK